MLSLARQHVEGRVDAEQDHFHIPALGRLDGNLGVVGADANMTDDAAVSLIP